MFKIKNVLLIRMVFDLLKFYTLAQCSSAGVLQNPRVPQDKQLCSVSFKGSMRVLCLFLVFIPYFNILISYMEWCFMYINSNGIL